MKSKYTGLLPLALAACASPSANAAGPSLSDVLVNSGISASGYVSASYDATLNRTGGAAVGEVPLHAFDTDSNTFTLNQAALSLSYLPQSGFGALVNVIAGEDAKVVNAAYSGGASGNDFALAQAYLQYANGNLTVIGGRFVTLAGAEVIDDSKNANISRSLLFANLEPLVHTGLRASYKFNDLVTAFGGINNSASGLSQDENKSKTLELGAAVTPTKAVSLAVTDYYGIDKTSGTQTRNNDLDLVASWQASSALQFVLNGDYVRGIGSLDATPAPFLAVANSALGLPPGSLRSGTPGLSSGEGLALYVNDQFSEHWRGSLRGEYTWFRSAPGGAAGAAVAHVAEITATVDYAAASDFDLLGEVREDYGSLAVPGAGGFGVFPDAANAYTGTQKSQTEFLVKAIYKFGTPSSS